MKYQLFDEDGIIGIVNGDRYEGYISKDWELEELTGLFVQQMNEQNLIVWKAADYGNDWNIDVLDKASANQAFRTLKKTIEVTSGELYLIDYTALTMMAQYENSTVKKEGKDNQKIKLENGIYNVTVRQMFDPEEDYEGDENENAIHFELIFNKQTQTSTTGEVFWWET